VDDAIVMIRKHRPLHRRERNSASSVERSQQIGFTIPISLTVSLIAVLIPLLFMGDICTLREFALR